jgi:3-phenylpropionate/cinnamic acid dioxygenase small subunit
MIASAFPVSGDGVASFVKWFEIQQRLFDEAAALDRRAYREWLSFLTDDATYWVPIRSTRAADDAEREFTKPGEPAFYDDNRRQIEARVVKLESGWSWSEDPPSRTRRYVTNVRVIENPAPLEAVVESNLLLYRTRLDIDLDLWAARRVDHLRHEGGVWKIAKRAVYLDQTVLSANNLGVFF